MKLLINSSNSDYNLYLDFFNLFLYREYSIVTPCRKNRLLDFCAMVLFIEMNFWISITLWYYHRKNQIAL